jgi:hypothetical protein
MPARAPRDEPLQLVQPGQIEVVGGLVEQEDVVAGQQQRGQSDAGGLPAGEADGRGVQGDPGSHLRDHLGRALLQVGAAERQPVLQCVAVDVVRARPARGEVLGGRVEGGLGGGHPGPPGERGQDGLALAPFVLLGQIAERGRRRADDDGAGLGGQVTGQRPQQCGLARAVDADEADDVTGSDDEIETGEQHAGAVTGRQTAGDEGGTHGM